MEDEEDKYEKGEIGDKEERLMMMMEREEKEKDEQEKKNKRLQFLPIIFNTYDINPITHKDLSIRVSISQLTYKIFIHDTLLLCCSDILVLGLSALQLSFCII